MRALILIGTTIGVAAPATAAPPACVKWQGGLTVCEALGIGSSTNCTYVPIGIENETANAVLFSNSALQACRQLIKKMKPAAYNYTSAKPIKACMFNPGTPTDNTCYPMPFGSFPWTTPTSAYCVYDANNDNKTDWNDASLLGYTVSLQTTQPDSHCSCTVNGPHTGLPWSGNIASWEDWQVVFGHKFPHALKQAILQHNFTTNSNSYKSEAILKTTGATFDPEPNLQKVDIYADDAAEIDHIIPRVDSKGCLCGDPTPNNAAVISRQLNAQMLNVSPKYNQDRARMYEKYVTCPNTSQWQFTNSNARRIDLLQNHQLDESLMHVDVLGDPMPRPQRRGQGNETIEENTEAGGCSAGGAAGLGIALSALGIRRRRRSA